MLVLVAVLDDFSQCLGCRGEERPAAGTRHPFYAKYKVGFTSQGVIKGLDLNIYNNAGALPPLPPSWGADKHIASALRCATSKIALSPVGIAIASCIRHLPTFEGEGVPTEVHPRRQRSRRCTARAWCGAPPTPTWHTVQCAAPQLPLRAASKSAWRGGCRTLPGPVQLHHGPGAAAHRCVQNEQKGALCRRFRRGSERRMQQRRFCLPAYSKFLSAFMLQGDGQLAQSTKHYALGFPRLAAPSSPASSLT